MTTTTTRFGATYPAELPDDDDGYTWRPTTLRIVREGDDERPWMLDAWDRETGRYTELVWTFETFAQAVASLPDFVAELRREGVVIP